MLIHVGGSVGGHLQQQHRCGHVSVPCHFEPWLLLRLLRCGIHGQEWRRSQYDVLVGTQLMERAAAKTGKVSARGDCGHNQASHAVAADHRLQLQVCERGRLGGWVGKMAVSAWACGGHMAHVLCAMAAARRGLWLLGP